MMTPYRWDSTGVGWLLQVYARSIYFDSRYATPDTGRYDLCLPNITRVDLPSLRLTARKRYSLHARLEFRAVRMRMARDKAERNVDALRATRYTHRHRNVRPSC